MNHLKNVPEENKKLSHKLQVFSPSALFVYNFKEWRLQTEIIQLYTTSVLMSKTLVPLHVAVRPPSE